MPSANESDLELLDASSLPETREAASDEIPVGIPRGDDELKDRPEWQLALRIAGSPRFSKSAFLRGFLLYVCRLQLTGRSQEVNETRIGVEVFHRPPDYNPAEDNVVRNYARTLRRRLDQYFQHEGSEEALRVSIPRGGYIPVFAETRTSQVALAADAVVSLVPEPAQEEAPATARPYPPAWNGWLRTTLPLAGAFVAGILVCLLLVAQFGRKSGEFAEAASDSSAARPVWEQIFQRDRDTLLVPTDSGLGILENLTRQSIPLNDYIGGVAVPGITTGGLDADNITDLRAQNYTSLVSLNIILSLSRLPEYDANHTFLRYPRIVSTNDLKHSNVILLGSAHTNPWVSLFEDRLNFRPTYMPEVNHSFVVNQHPRFGEQPIYRNESGPSRRVTYGLIDFVPNLDHTGHVLILQGLNMAGTQAAADVLMHSSELEVSLRQATLPNGTVQPFEILVRTETLGADAPRAEIVAMHVAAS